MNASQKVKTRSFTLNDIHVGSRLYEALVEHAMRCPGEPVRYGDLLHRCRELYPEDAVVQSAVPIGIGMKLLFVQAFCDQHGYPNLACLAVNATGRPGEGYPGNWEQDMLAVARFDWSVAPAKLAIYVAEATARVKPRPVRKPTMNDDAAREALWKDFRRDRSRYVSFSAESREHLVRLMMDGVDIETAYTIAMQAKNDGQQAA